MSNTRLIEEAAEANDYSLEDPSVVAARNLERAELEKANKKKKKKSKHHTTGSEAPSDALVPHSPLDPLALTAGDDEEGEPLPEGWSQAMDPSGYVYYFSTSGETSWDRPTEAANENAWGAEQGWDANAEATGAGEQSGYYDEAGNWIDGYYDENGTWIQGFYDEDGNWIQGYYDENGEWVDTSAYASGGYYDADYDGGGGYGGGYEGDDGFGETYGGYDYYGGYEAGEGYEQADYQDGDYDDAGYDGYAVSNDTGGEGDGAIEEYDPSGEAYQGDYAQAEAAGGDEENGGEGVYAEEGEAEEFQGYNEEDDVVNYDEGGAEGDEFEGDAGEQTEWQELVDENGNTYWYYESTGETQY